MAEQVASPLDGAVGVTAAAPMQSAILKRSGARPGITVGVLTFGLLGVWLFSPRPLNGQDETASADAAMTSLRLHVEGRHIKDSRGQVVILRGVNQPGFADTPTGLWNPKGGSLFSGVRRWGPDAVKANLDAMERWGLNVVRGHQAVRYWIDNEGKTRDGTKIGITYREAVKEVVKLCADRQMYYIFDPYCIRGYGEEGSGQDPMPFPPYSIEHQKKLVPPVIPGEAAFVQYWRDVATELKPFPNVIFEIFNEPVPVKGVGKEQAMRDWRRVWQECVDAIRSTGATQPIVIQWDYGIWCNLNFPPPRNAGATMDWVEKNPFHDPLGNLVYSFHIYRYHGSFHYSLPERKNVWEYGDIRKGLELCLVDNVLRKLNKPVICGEIGANMWCRGEELKRELACLENSLKIFGELGIGYVVWVWTSPAHMNCGVLQNAMWVPGPNEAGRTLIEAARRSR